MPEPTEVSIGADVDVHAIMEEIRAEVRRKRDQGLYPPDVLLELDTVQNVDDSQDALRRSVADLQRTAGFSAVVPTASRKGPVVSTTKAAIQKAVRWYLTGILHQVHDFAAHTVRAVALLVERVRTLEEAHVASDERSASALAALRDEFAEVRGEIEALLRTHDEERVRDRLAQLDRAVRSLRDGLEQRVVPAGAATTTPDREGARSWSAERELNYFEFENRFRGTLEQIADRQRAYVDLYRGAPGPVADLGCGRGEFLDLLREAGIASYGVDRHPDMVAFCRDRGLDVRHDGALEHLQSLEPGSLGGVFAAQMIEHFDPPEVVRFFELAARALAPGGVLLAETINPESLFVFAHAFYVDLGHLRPLHPLTLSFLAETSGFSQVRIEYSSPPPPEFRPQPLDGDDDVTRRINENFRRIDELLFGPQDYAVVAVR